MIWTTFIHIPGIWNLNLVEAIWLSVGLFSLCITGVHIPVLYEDYRTSTYLTEDPVLRVVAFSYLRREIVRFLQAVAIVVIGIYAGVQPPPPYLPGGGDVVSVTGLVLTGVLLSIGILVSAQSQWDWHDRHVAQSLIAKTTGQE